MKLVRNLSSLTRTQARSRFSALTNYAKTLKLQEDRLKKKLTRSTLKLYKEWRKINPLNIKTVEESSVGKKSALKVKLSLFSYEEREAWDKKSAHIIKLSLASPMKKGRRGKEVHPQN